MLKIFLATQLLGLALAGGFGNSGFSLGVCGNEGSELAQCYKEAHKAGYGCVKQIKDHPGFASCQKGLRSQFTEWWAMSMRWHRDFGSCLRKAPGPDGDAPSRKRRAVVGNLWLRRIARDVDCEDTKSAMEKCTEEAMKCKPFKDCWDSLSELRDEKNEMKEDFSKEMRACLDSYDPEQTNPDDN